MLFTTFVAQNKSETMKYSINFTPEKCRNNPEEGNIRMIVQWSGGGRVSMFVGHRVVLAKWSKEAQRCKQNTMHGQYLSSRINKDIQKYEDAVNKVMQGYDEAPTNQDAKSDILRALGREETVTTEGRNFFVDLTQFTLEQSKVKSWSDKTSESFIYLKKLLKKYNPGLRYSDVLTPEKQEELISYLHDSKLKASTAKSYIDHLNWFLRWAGQKEYISKAPNYKPAIKKAPKKIIFLTTQELLSLFHHEFKSKFDRRTRDFFCFCCFTGLRHSDAFSLKKNNIKDNTVSLVSKKDVDNLYIELNKFSKEILNRVELTDEEKKAGLVLPHLQTTFLNKSIKKIAKEVGINEPVTLVYYKGGRRITEVKEKWEVVSSHTGRKTFICTALSQGVSPAIVIKWTGHSNYEAMKPYIDIIDEAKKEAMTAFDKL